MSKNISGRVRVPATTANLGPGFDTLGLALDLWNEIDFQVSGSRFLMEIIGEGSEYLSRRENNLIVRTIDHVLKDRGQSRPPGLQIRCRNNIPTSSGLGSSASAVLAGTMIANRIMDNSLTKDEIIGYGNEIEGHVDNIAPALLGGLTVSTSASGELITRELPIHRWNVLIILPKIRLSTREARQVLPRKVKMKSAVKNIGRSLLTLQALQEGNQELLLKVMKDKVHQPYRLKLIPHAKKLLKIARKKGIPGALSGAGPSLIFFSTGEFPGIKEDAGDLFGSKGIHFQTFRLKPIDDGAEALTAIPE